MDVGRTPLLLPLAALIAGITAAIFLPGAALLTSIIFIAAACCLWFIRSHHAALFCLFVSIGAFAQYASTPPSVKLPDGESAFVGRIESVRHDNSSRLLQVDVDGIGIVDIRLYGAEPILESGDVIRFLTQLHKPEQVAPVVPDEIDFSATDAVAVCRISSADVTLIERHTPLRRVIADKILGSHLSDAAGAMVCALLVGETGLLTDNMRSDFAAAGLSHVLAISGLHVGVITMLIALALFPLYLGRHNRTRLLLTIGLLWGYAFMTGFAPSVTRAVIMATVYMFGRVIQRHGEPLNSLCFAAIVILVANPGAIASISFQLSFTAVVGILTFTPLINRIDRRRHPFLYNLVGYPAVSVAAMSFTGILSAYYFHAYPLYFLSANLLIAPLVPLLIGGGALLVSMDFLGFGTIWLCRFLDGITQLCNYVASVVASLPGHSVSGLYFHWWIVIAMFGAILLAAYAGYRRNVASLIAAVAVTVLTYQLHNVTRPVYPAHEYYFLNDRAASNILVRNADTLYLLSSAKTPPLRDEQLEHCRVRFRHYQARRDIDTMMLCPDTLFTPWLSRRGPHFSIAGRRYRFLSDNCFASRMRIDYLIVAGGFTGDIVKAYGYFSPDSAVILSTSLHPRRLKRYCAELDAASVPFIVQ